MLRFFFFCSFDADTHDDVGWLKTVDQVLKINKTFQFFNLCFHLNQHCNLLILG